MQCFIISGFKDGSRGLVVGLIVGKLLDYVDVKRPQIALSQNLHIHNVTLTFVFSMRVIECSSVVFKCVIVWKQTGIRLCIVCVLP